MVGALVPHLLGTSGASRVVVFVDCETSGGTDVMAELGALARTVASWFDSFEYTCVNVSEAAKVAWSRTWAQDPEVPLAAWPDGLYTSVVRLATHHFLSELCHTRYCAWTDSDVTMLPSSHVGWAEGLKRCLVFGAEKHPAMPPVFAVPEWVTNSRQWQVYLQDAGQTLLRGEHRYRIEGIDYAEFSGQVYVVDRFALRAWLPIPRDMMNYTDEFVKLMKESDFELAGWPLDCSIERFVVAKANFEYVTTCLRGAKCLPVVQCKPYQLKWHPDDQVKFARARGNETYAEFVAGMSRVSDSLWELEQAVDHVRHELRVGLDPEGLPPHGPRDNLT